jgi:hypothetical protein
VIELEAKQPRILHEILCKQPWAAQRLEDLDAAIASQQAVPGAL